jgi:NTP pyrophosphatase (non-canonical NTP hydrolase)
MLAMTLEATASIAVSDEPDYQSSDITIPQLVGEVFEAAPAVERGRLLEQLLRPLGVLSLFAVADGVFAAIRFRGGWQDFRVRLEDVQSVRSRDVISLVEYVQQVSVEVVDGLARTLTASPMLAGSAAAVLLVAVLLQRDSLRRMDAEAVTVDAEGWR